MSRISAAAVALALCLLPTPGSAADQSVAGPGGGRDVISATGVCTAGSSWLLAARSRSLRILIGARLTTPATGQRWRIRLGQNRQPVAASVRRSNRRGAVALRRSTANAPGIDTFTLAARNPTTGETCRGTLSY